MLSKNVAHYAWIPVLAVATLVHATGFRPGHEWGADYAWNWAQAVSLLDGTTEEIAAQGAFRLREMPDLIIGPAVYPWGYPAILAIGHAIWGHSVDAMKTYMLGFYMAGFAVFYLIIRNRIAPLPAAAILAVVAFAPSFFDVKNSLRSEAPFFFLFMLAIYLIARHYKDANRPAPWQSILLGLTVFFAYWTRSHGVVLLAPLLLAQLLQRRFSPIPYLVFAACVGMTKLLPGDTSYLGSGHLAGFSEAPANTLWKNVHFYLLAPGSHFAATDTVRIVIGCAVHGLAALGAFKRRRDDLILLAACAAYASILAIYPFRQARFLFPVMPFLFYFACHGLQSGRIRALVASSAALACIVITLIKWTGDRPPIEGPYTPEAKAFFDYVKTTDPGSVFLFWKPRSLTFYGERRAFFRTETACPAQRVAIYTASHRPAFKRRNTALEKLAVGPPLFENHSFRVFRTSCDGGNTR